MSRRRRELIAAKRAGCAVVLDDFRICPAYGSKCYRASCLDGDVCGNGYEPFADDLPDWGDPENDDGE